MAPAIVNGLSLHTLLSACSLLILILAFKNVFPVNAHVGKQNDFHNNIEQSRVEEEVNSAQDCREDGPKTHPSIYLPFP